MPILTLVQFFGVLLMLAGTSILMSLAPLLLVMLRRRPRTFSGRGMVEERAALEQFLLDSLSDTLKSSSVECPSTMGHITESHTGEQPISPQKQQATGEYIGNERDSWHSREK